ncbi:hypothetical protein DPSP01_012272 [Paraphaeosphaeria sporulosa]|uniref:Uncharacterized protein n=1 Tax=Paraphaeosphaeria sporulosa TaxID=1460663 RepID=A0A177CSZ9_9PLEO|nr:uncharacterized protein CC84DRAFT_1213960 [Paraphaeosphaeria sporulosa]OAG10653.1 hypothetical protein CC84DRAFT_1213960 [Paraphaeosphaeria sporulosa]
MSSSSYSYGSSYAQDKSKSYASRSSSPRSTTSTSSSTSSSSLYAHRGHSTRNNRYGSKPGSAVIHNGGGQSTGPSSTSAGNSGYYQ